MDSFEVLVCQRVLKRCARLNPCKILGKSEKYLASYSKNFKLSPMIFLVVDVRTKRVKKVEVSTCDAPDGYLALKALDLAFPVRKEGDVHKVYNLDSVVDLEILSLDLSLCLEVEKQFQI